jgi:hypothetical protein
VKLRTPLLALVLLALGGCVLAPKVVRDASAGRVTTPDAHTPIAGASVRLRMSPLALGGCSASVLRTIETETDAEGRWQLPRLDAWRLETVLDGEPAGFCQRYDLPQHLDVPALVTTSDIKRNTYSRGRTAQISLNETSANGAPRMRLISALLADTDQIAAFYLGGVVVLSEAASMLSLRAVAQPGLRASSLAVGLRAGRAFAGDLSARVVRRGAEPVRLGPELGIEFAVLRLYLGVTGALSGRQRWIPFAGGGIVLTL